jgi:serine/threonine protein kinase
MTAQSSIAATEPLVPLLPLSLDGFELGPLLGEGRLGAVHAAREPGGRGAAIKILDPALCTDPRRVAAYLNEAAVVGALRHPNMVEILDLGELPDGRAYVIMELLEGESLGQRLRRVQALPLVDVIDFARQAAAALAAAHDEGLVHGALEPENLFLVPDLSVTRGERVKVLDFGASRLGGTAAASVGSRLYLAPEQGSGPIAAVDQRADVFGLAAILYHALCGGPPFPAGVAGPDLDQPPEKPSALTEVPPPVERALLRALAMDPEARFPSMAAFIEALAGTDAPAAAPGPALRIGTLAIVLSIGAVVLWSTRAPALLSSWMQPGRAPAAVSAAMVPLAGAALPSAAPVMMAGKLTSTARPRRSTAGPRRARQQPARRAAAIIDRDDTWGRRH